MTALDKDPFSNSSNHAFVVSSPTSSFLSWGKHSMVEMPPINLLAYFSIKTFAGTSKQMRRTLAPEESKWKTPPARSSS